MTAPTTYATLQTSVKNHLHRADLDSMIPEFIQLGEARLNRRLRTRDMITTSTVTPSQVNKYVSLPTGFLEMISFTDDLGDELQEVDYAELDQISYSSGTGRPSYYAIGARIDFDRVASSAVSYPIRYFQKLDIVTDLTNNVLVNNPDTYVYSALLGAQPYLKDDSRITVWAQLLDTTIKEINHRERRSGRKLRTDISAGGGFNIIRGH